MDGAAASSEHVKSLDRGLQVIRCLAARSERMTLSEVAQSCDLSRAAARRFLLTLQRIGYVGSDGRYFSLKPQVIELGYSYLASQPWWRKSQEALDKCVAAVAASGAVGVLHQRSVVYVAYSKGAKFAAFNRSVGTQLPAYATALGRVLLADLPEDALAAHLPDAPFPSLTPFTLTRPEQIHAALATVRAEGYCIVEQELEIGLASMAVAVRNPAGRTIAGLSVSFFGSETRDEDVRTRALVGLREAAARIGEDAGKS